MKRAYTGLLQGFLIGVLLALGVGAVGYVSYEPEPPTQLELLLEKHHCWNETQEAPIPYPRGVVVTEGDSPPEYQSEPAQVERALEHALGDRQIKGLTVWGFCL